MTTRSLLTALPTALLAAALLAGCSGGSDDPADGGGSTGAATTAAATTAAAPATTAAANPAEAGCRAKLSSLLKSGALQEDDLDTPPAECAGYSESQLVRFLGEELQSQMQSLGAPSATP